MFHTDSSLGTSQRGKLGQSIVVWCVIKVMPFASTRLWLQKLLAQRVHKQSPLAVIYRSSDVKTSSSFTVTTDVVK